MIPTRVAVSQTAVPSATEAGKFLGNEISTKLDGDSPDVLIVFASPEYLYAELLQALEECCRPRILLGCSSAGEFSGSSSGIASASVTAISSTDIVFNAVLSKGLRAERAGALQQLSAGFTGDLHPEYPYRCVLVLTDALAGYADELIHELTVQTSGTYQLFGGGAALSITHNF